VTALKSGQLDGVEVPVPPTSVAALKAHFLVRSSLGDAFDDFIINSNPQQQASHGELLNPLLRQAFDHAINRQAIVATSLLGHGQPGAAIIPPATGQWSDPSIKPTPFSLATANQLLDKAGYKMGPNGLRVANGHPMSYTVVMPSDLAGEYEMGGPPARHRRAGQPAVVPPRTGRGRSCGPGRTLRPAPVRGRDPRIHPGRSRHRADTQVGRGLQQARGGLIATTPV
jgi:extracellular solute-binding protein (family 5)